MMQMCQKSEGGFINLKENLEILWKHIGACDLCILENVKLSFVRKEMFIIANNADLKF